MKVHHLRTDVVGGRYRELVSRLLDLSGSFSLVLRDDLGFKPESSAVLKWLTRHERGRKRCSAWPGTQTFGSKKPIVVHFEATLEALDPLCTPAGLFSWRAPEYPEDLAFYDSSSEVLMASTAHEREAWVLQARAARTIGSLITLEIEDVAQDVMSILRGAA